MPRLVIVSAPFLIAILLYLGLTAIEQGEMPTTISSDSADTTYQAYSEGLNTVLFNLAGNIDYTLQASRQVHYGDNHSELEDPWVRLFDTQNGNWNIVADSGTISGSSEMEQQVDSIELNGNVEVRRLDLAGSRMQLNTETLTVNPKQQSIATDSPVYLVSGAIVQSAIGMRADMIREEMIFIRDVQGRYEIPAN